MSDNGDQLKAISWRDLCPWLIIFRTFGLSISLSVLILASLGAVLTPIGWWLSGWAFIPDGADPAMRALVERNSQCPLEPLQLAVDQSAGGVATRMLAAPVGALQAVWYQQFVLPFQRLFDTEISLSHFAYFLFGGLWTLLVWAYFGGAISRIAAMQLGREERVGLREAMQLACRKYASYVAAPLLPLLGVVLAGLPIAVLGLFMMADWGVIIGGVFWILALLAAFVMAVLLLGLLFGWPLMWATVSAEGSDAFDGLSRSYAYTFQRPLHYLFYALIASAFGALCFALVYFFASALIELCYWAASWGTNLTNVLRGQTQGPMRIAEIKQAVAAISGPATAPEASGSMWLGALLIFMFNGVIHIVVRGFIYGFFWSAVTAIYLLLRRDVDQTEMDEVWIEEEEQVQLPPIQPDETTEGAAAKQKPESEAPAPAETAEQKPAESQQAPAETGAEEPPTGGGEPGTAEEEPPQDQSGQGGEAEGEKPEQPQ